MTGVVNIKPYLFPLSSMTNEQLFEVQNILGKNEIKIENDFLRIVDSNRNTISYLEISALLEWFYKNHFDIYGLIPMGLLDIGFAHAFFFECAVAIGLAH